MGIKGLTSALRQCGLLPSFSEETEEMFSSIPNRNIPTGSTFAIDGCGFAFYVYKIAYFEHFKRIMANKDSYENDIHLIMHLLPSMLPLQEIHVTTKKILELLMFHGINICVYLDGKKQLSAKLPLTDEEESNDILDASSINLIFKLDTVAQREQSRMEQESALSRFFKKQILPASFRSGKTRNGSKIVKIPNAHTFMQEFPVPTLLFEEVYHTFHSIANQQQLLHSKNLKHDSSPIGYLKVVECESEADQAVALASALDVTNQTYAIGQDSDYLIFGVPSNDPSWTLGDLHVQYLPLDSLVINEDKVSGCLITRQCLAQEFHLEEDMIVEAAILCGNDYTKFMNDKKLRKNVNFFRDEWKHKNPHPKLVDIFDAVSELDLYYQVQSEDCEQQLCIEFSRTLFQLQDISQYLEEEDDEHNEEKKIDEEKIMKQEIMENHIHALDETLIKQSERYFDGNDFCIKSEIMAPFEQQLVYDENITVLLKETLDIMCTDFVTLHDQDSSYPTNNSMYEKIPSSLSWQDFMLAEVFQKSIQAALKRQVSNDYDSNEYRPSRIFDHYYFYHALAKRHNVMSKLEKDESSHDSNDIKPEKNVQRKILPIDEHKEEILSSIKHNRVTIIQGETGCGKSSRVPVMLLESPPPDPSFRKVKMFICQPRRIAAKSLTERVRSSEPHLRELFGLKMGHGIREYNTKKTCAWFVTTGYLVRYLANNIEEFADVTHLVIDEVHERSIDSDILCLLAKRLLEVNPTIRLVLMSATVEANLYQDYFEVTQPPIFVGVRCHSINEYFAEDIAKRLNFSKKERAALSDIVEKCLKGRCQVSPNQHYMTKLYHLAAQIAVDVGAPGSSVLIFVPGMSDIVAITDIFDLVVSNTQYKVIPIHSDVPFEDQMSVFDMAEKNEVKVIVATNAAESSITLPDVDNIICFGLCKSIKYNNKSHRQILETSWISRANATQRAGRTGRVREGNVYRLYPKIALDTFFNAFEEGEILRSPLDSVILNLKTIIQKEENITQLLLDCIEAPDVVNIKNSFLSLYQRKFITEASDKFDVTSLGRFVVAMGIDLAIAAMVGFGIRFGLLPETIEMAAILSFPKSPWLLPNAILQDPECFNDIMSKTYVSKAKFDSELYSEPFCIMNLLYDFDRCKNKNAFCRNNSISYPRICRLASTRNNLVQRVAQHLGKEANSLSIRRPPREMDISKLLALRVVQIWIFSDGIVKLPAQREKTSNVSTTLELNGDVIKDIHLEQILDKSRHHYTLKSDCNMIYNGSFEPVQVDYQKSKLSVQDFEERLISFSIERNFDFIVNKIDKTINLYTCIDNETDTSILLNGDFSANGQIIFEPKTSQRGGICSRWSNTCSDVMSANCKKFQRYTLSSNSKSIKNKLRQLREKIRNRCMGDKNTFIVDITKITGGAVHIYSYSSEVDEFGKVDFISLFRTPHVKLKKSSSCNMRQSVLFHEPEEEGSFFLDDKNQESPIACAFAPRNSPEGARLCKALAAGRRSKPMILFEKTAIPDGDDKSDEDFTSYLEVTIKPKYNMNRWLWTETNESALLDSDSIPATIEAQTHDVYACCGNILELKGGRIRAEGVTIVPSGNFINLAKKCIGLSPPNEVCNDIEDSTLPVSIFYDYFNEVVEKSDLEYFSRGVELLCQVFAINPWSEETDGSDKFDNSVAQTRRREATKTKRQYQCKKCLKRDFDWNKLKMHVSSEHGIKLTVKEAKEMRTWVQTEHSENLQVVMDYESDKKQSGQTTLATSSDQLDLTRQSNSDQLREELCISLGEENVPLCFMTSFIEKVQCSDDNDLDDIIGGNVRNMQQPVKSDTTAKRYGNDLNDTVGGNGHMQQPVKSETAAKTKRRYQCKQCLQGDFKWKTLKKHVSSKHGILLNEEDVNNWVQCSDGNVLGDNIESNGHTQQPVKIDTAAKTKRKYQCKKCLKRDFKWKTLKKHVSSEHGMLLNEGDVNNWVQCSDSNDLNDTIVGSNNGHTQQPVKSDIAAKTKRRYQCKECLKRDFKWKTLKKHVSSKHGILLNGEDVNNWVQCSDGNVLGDTIESNGHTQQPVKIVTAAKTKRQYPERKYQCKKCLKRDFDWNKLKMHVSSEHGIKLKVKKEMPKKEMRTWIQTEQCENLQVMDDESDKKQSGQTTLATSSDQLELAHQSNKSDQLREEICISLGEENVPLCFMTAFDEKSS